jgi:signal transduction histidine kinase
MQLAGIAVSITIGWAFVSRGLAERRDARAAETRATSAIVSRLETQVAELGSVTLALQSAQRNYLLTRDDALLTPYRAAERRFTALRDSVAFDIPPFHGARVAFVTWLGAVSQWRRDAAQPSMLLIREGASPADARVRATVALGNALMDSAVAAREALRGALAAEARLQRELAAADARDDARELLLVRIAVLTSVLLVVVLMTRSVRNALNVVVRGAEALAEGAYASARIPTDAASSNAELARLATAFDRLSVAVSRREETLQTEMRSLREIERMKTDFVSTVSHELRTPLTSIRGALGLLLGGKVGAVPETAVPLLRIALQNTERLVRLINDILDIEKMESARFEVRRDSVDLYQVLDATVAGIQEFAREHTVTVRLAGDTSADIVGDSDRLVQLFTNLVSNAVKFSPPGETVDVRLECDSGRAMVSVTDRGPGIPEEFRARIFGRFQQAEGTSGGTGLGLAIVQRIAQLHGAEVSFDSAVGRGTVFRVAIALAPRPSAEYAVDDGRPRILMVEDDQSMIDILTTLAQPYGQVVAAHTAEEAIAIARRGRVNVMLIDPDLSGMDGFDLVRRLRAMDVYHSLPVLVFTASEYDAERYDDIRVPPAHVFVKSRHAESMVIRRLRAVLAAHGHA